MLLRVKGRIKYLVEIREYTIANLGDNGAQQNFS